ncbi:3-dehydroquinate synthase [Betaproteobacteria bacterium PRO7]|jgi:3-dehydroquinate synthase|nr:3-dehydroquinate synthase [Betaproteobacteria bacterium PRO7]GIL04081.1 MAG: 3-dehydroquinate synthase [Betaproteobacteria bacterium]
MQRVHVGLAGSPYEIHIGGALLARIDTFVAPLAPTSILIVSDATVAPLYGETALAAARRVAPTALLELIGGEQHKTMATVGRVLDALVASGADRRSLVVALGGGVVGDIAGFAAAIYMRGIRYAQAPTTLLAQVDSSVGGKTGVNHPRGKNLIGAFHQPALVLSDTDTLRTLPPRELSAGLAEVLKHGLLADADYFERTLRDLPRLLACDEEALAAAIARSCEIKAGVVARDEREAGERALLNLGHTFGHAIEALTGFSRWLHGEAVGCGLCLAADLSHRLGLIARADVERIEAAVAAARLPTRIEGLSLRDALESMRGDKKAEAGRVKFVLLERIGRAVQRTVPDEAVAATLAAAGYR